MEPLRFVDVIRTETAGLLTAARAAGLEASVPSCPGWTVTDLLAHVGTVQRWSGALVERRAQEPASPVEADRPDDPGALPEWVQAGSARLVEILGATPPDTLVWTFSGPGPASFWSRRQAHEVSLHRVDAELAAGSARPIDAAVARDAIDEFLDVVVMFRLRDRLIGTGETVHLHRTDGEGEWLVRLTPGGPEVERAHAKGDVAVRGPASDLLLAARGRAGLDALEVFGDVACFERFRELASI